MLFAELAGSRSGQIYEPALGSAVSGAVREGTGTGDRGNIHHLTATGFAELGDRPLHQEKRALEVEIELFVPQLLGCLHNRYRPKHTGIVDQNIKAAELGDHRIDQTIDIIELGDIGLERFRGAALRLDRRDDGIGPLRACVVADGDLGAFLGIALGDCLADPLGRPGYQGNFIF